MLYLIGLGLWDVEDISLRGLEILKSSDFIFAEFYTNQKKYNIKKLERLIDKEIKILSREEVENETFLKLAKKNKVVLLVPGDPLVATTHQQIILDAKKSKIKTKIIHSSSIVSAISETGLHIYKFGKITSIPHWSNNFKPTSFMKIIKENKSIGAHTLVLLDVNPPMNIKEAIDILCKSGLNKKEKMLAVEQIGNNVRIRYGNVKDLAKLTYNKYPQCIVIPGKLHFTEEEFIIANYKI